MDRQIRQVLSLQLALILVASLGGYAIWGLGVAQAVCFGAGIAAVNTLMIAWRMRQGRTTPAAQPSLSEFYRSWLERYLLLGVLLAAGLGGLKLMPLGLLSGFILGQVIWIFAPLTVEAGARDTEEK
ncbi:MAG: ATP synthase subunit I [Burkholderiales bacterium]|nr:ATP synthase subunit I [Burkholderiales bacterium]